jgi:hypothetical protein
MYVTKNEAQAFADSAAIAAVRELDNTTDGINRAKAAVSANPNRWQFANTVFSSVTTTFATAEAGPYTATPPNPPLNYQYARVVTTVDLPMYLIRVVSGPTAQIAAGAVAGKSPMTSTPGGGFPFSPYTRKGYPGAVPDDAGDPFGFSLGNLYTLRWGAPGDKTTCGTDGDVVNLASNGSIRGYCCVHGSAAAIREAIVGGQTDPITIGQSVPMDNGAKNTEMTAIALRVQLDSDQTSAHYTDYFNNGTGNGARVVMVPVNGGPPDHIALGFAGFFLLPPGEYTKLNGNESACAEYIGAWVGGVPRPPTGGSGAYRIRLFR